MHAPLNRSCLNSVENGTCDIFNYYEYAVQEALFAYVSDLSEDEIADVACIALNALPVWYIRHAVDASYYLDDEARGDMDGRIRQAIRGAIDKMLAQRDMSGRDSEMG